MGGHAIPARRSASEPQAGAVLEVERPFAVDLGLYAAAVRDVGFDLVGVVVVVGERTVHLGEAERTEK